MGLAAAGNSLARVLGEQLLFKESAATADGVLSELGEADDVESAWLRLRAAVARNMFSDDPADLAPTAAAVIPIAERDGDRELALEARLAVVSVADTTDPKFATNAAEVVRLARELGRPDVECRALRMEAIATAQLGDDPVAFLDEAAGVAVNHGLDEALGWVDYLRADLAFARGDWDEAMAAGTRAIDLAERRQYHRVAVRSWFVVVPIATARDDRAVLDHADRWFTASDAFFPDSPYGRLMHTSVELHLSSRGVRAMPDLSPERLLPSFTVDPSASWLEAADIILRAWLATGRRDAVEEAVQRMRASAVSPADAFTEAAIDVMRARSMFAAGDPDGAILSARTALARIEDLRAAWWSAKALRLLERAGVASAEESAAAAAIERRLGVVGQAP
jgi:tetratricopeptide (TPR) repeat protein